MSNVEYPRRSWSRGVDWVLKTLGVRITVLVLTCLVALLSLTFTSLCLQIFQGYIDLLGVAISVLAPSLILPIPALWFFRLFMLLQKTREDLQAKNLNLEEALAQVKTLSGLLPVCCSCKKIRDESGGWLELEDYLADNSQAELTHGFCPDCVERLYPELQHT